MALDPSAQNVHGIKRLPRYSTYHGALNALEREFEGIESISEFLDINLSHLRNYYYGYRSEPSPTLKKKLREKNLIQGRVTSQVTWKSQEQKEKYLTYLESMGFGSLTKYILHEVDTVP
jgi:hypothetical protein